MWGRKIAPFCCGKCFKEGSYGVPSRGCFLSCKNCEEPEEEESKQHCKNDYRFGQILVHFAISPLFPPGLLPHVWDEHALGFEFYGSSGASHHNLFFHRVKVVLAPPPSGI